MRIAKAIVAGVGAVAAVLTAALADDVLSAPESTALVMAMAEAVGTVVAVWAVPNRPA